MEYQYSKKFFIGYSDVDINNKCKLSKIVDLLQNTGILHSKKVGYSAKKMISLGRAWLMRSWKIKILKYPESDMDVEVRTWCGEINGVEAKRSFEIISEEGETLILADSLWFLYDSLNHKLLKVPKEMKEAYGKLDRKVFESDKIEKIKDNDIIENQIEIVVGKRDMDTNKHMNNSKYMEYIVEVLPENEEVLEFQNIYKKEVGCGEKIKISYGDGICRIKNENDEVMFLMKINKSDAI